MKKILILGAGPAGATAAYCLSKLTNVEVHIIEKSSEIGGMARTIRLFDQLVDIGPHRFFSTDNRVNQLWLEIVGREYKMVQRQTRILYNKKFFSYPLKPFDALFKLGLWNTFQCLASYALTKITTKQNLNTFEGWVSDRFGVKLYEIFFKSYTEKLWGIPCSELNATFAQQRIKKFSLAEAIISAFKLNKSSHKTLVDEFAYPIEGTGSVYEKMIKKAQEKGIKFSSNTFLTSISPKVDGFEVQDNHGKIEHYDEVISSMPITDFLKLYKATPDDILAATKDLKFRNTIIVYVHVSNESLFEDQWLYIQEENIQTGRITNFNNWISEINPNKVKGTVLALEYWCFESDSIWQYEEKEFQAIASEDLTKCGFISSNQDIIDLKVFKVPKCYPLYDNYYEASLEKVTTYLKSIPKLHFIGRYGSFKYNNQDHSILMAYLAVENMKAGKIVHNLWEINTDYEYQESSLITDTGLHINK